MLSISAVLFAVVFFLSHFVGFLPLRDFGPSELAELRTYIQVLAVMIFVYTLSGMCGTGLECLKYYAPNKYAALFVSLASIVGVILFGKENGIVVAIYSALAGIALHALYVTVMLRRKVKFRLILPRPTSHVKQVLMLSLPIMLGTAVNSINSLIDKCIAVSVGKSVVSSLNYAHLVAIELVTAVIVTAVSSIMIARFADNARRKDFSALNANINLIVSLMMLVVVPVVMLFLTHSREIMTIIFKRGAFDENALVLSSLAFAAYSVALFFIPLREVLIRVQYSCQNSRTPMLNSVACILVNIVLSLLLSRFFGISGIAAATSISIALNAWLNYTSVRRLTCLSLTNCLKNIVTFILSAVVAGAICYWMKGFLNVNVYVDFFVFCVFYAVLYLLALFLFNRTVVKQCISLLIR